MRFMQLLPLTLLLHIVVSLHLPRHLCFHRNAKLAMSLSVSGLKPNVVKNTPILLQASSLTKTYVDTPQFKDINLQLQLGQCVALVGPNGAGKSTLLKCLAGVDTADGGSISISSSHNLVYVPQDNNKLLKLYGYHVLFHSLDKKQKLENEFKTLIRYYDTNRQPGSMSSSEKDEVTTEYYISKASEIDEKALEILKLLQLSPEKLYSKVSELSGGESKKLSLASAMLQEGSVLLLDEPTNHLDMAAIHTLAEYVNLRNGGVVGSSTGSKGKVGKGSGGGAGGKGMDGLVNPPLAVLLVTHDRFFIDSVCDFVYELEGGRGTKYDGKWKDYVGGKEELRYREKKERDRLEAKLEKEEEWMVRQPRARQAKSKHREGEVMRLRDEVEGGRKRSMLLRGSEMQLGGMGEVGRLGGKVLEMREAGYRVEGPDIRKGEEGKVLFQDFIFSLCPGERVAVIGGNGSGKTSLLSLLSGLKKLTWGTLDKGESVSVGYFSQSLPPLPVEAEGMTAFAYLLSEINKRAIKDGEGRKSGGPMLKVTEVDIASRRKRKEGKTSVVTASVVDYVGKESVGPSENEVRKWLKDFNLPPSVWYTPLLKLSGGERRRLELLRVLASRPNVLLLDEPTNDLDIYALYALENYLANEFTTSDGDEKAGGAVVFVSHDSYFVQNVAQRVLVMPGKGKKEKSILEVQGGYEEYKKRTDTGQKIE